MLHAGFTGTRNGLSRSQEEGLDHLLSRFDLKSFRHGVCIGSDEQAHKIARFNHIRVYGYPCNLTAQQAQIPREEFEWYGDHYVGGLPDPLERNRDIVESTDFLIACPKSRVEERRSGTWATIRYAQKLERPVFILL